MQSKIENPKNLLAAAWRNFGFSPLGTCRGFANSHGGVTEAWGMAAEILNILTDDNQYLWNDVLSESKYVDNSENNETIDLVKKKSFLTITCGTCGSIGRTLTGAVEIGTGGILYVDDIIEDLEASLIPMSVRGCCSL